MGEVGTRGKDGSPDERSAAQIEADIVRTRLQLAATLDALAVAVHPATVVGKAKADVRSALDRTVGRGYVAANRGVEQVRSRFVDDDLALPILAVPTTYSGSEATPIWGLSDGERKLTGKHANVLPRVIVYDPDLTLALPAAVSAASAMNAIAHCVEGLWVPDRTPFLMALATDAARRFAAHLPRVIADGTDRDARGECLVAAWLAGVVLASGTGLQHKLAHVLGGLGLPHAEAHAVILPHVTRFNLAAAPDARARLAAAFLPAEAASAAKAEPADRLAAMLRGLPIPRRLADIGFDPIRIDFVAEEIEALSLAVPRPVSADDVRELLAEAY